MTSPPCQITIRCPSCALSFEDWWRPSINLQLDDFDQEYIKSATIKTCPGCGARILLETLIVDEEGIWHLDGAGEES